MPVIALTAEQRKHWFRAGHDHLDYIQEHWDRARLFSQQTLPDGFPAGGGGEGRSSGDHADPTYAATQRRAARDHFDRAQQKFAVALTMLGDARKELDLALPPKDEPAPKKDTTAVDWCSSCQRVALPGGRGRVCEPAFRAGLCRWCYSFKLEHETLPPEALLAQRHSGKRISERDVTEALAEERRREKAGKAKKRRAS